MLITVKYPHEEASRNLAGTIAMTMINRVPMSMNIYDAYQDGAAFVKQLRLQQQVVRTLIKANSDGINKSTH
jgi:hypothetical protein